ncbi:MAG: sugar phosphate isomerase/epimerase [Gemmatimonadetes bacterium]|nr:sugar phosphate isomerase/epimerase [Gemmatimonadota bacterium]
MKLCCTSVMLPRWTLDETFDKLAEYGYEAVELRCRFNPDDSSAEPAFWGRHLSDVSPDNIVDKAPAIRAAAERSGVRVAALAPKCLIDEEDEIRKLFIGAVAIDKENPPLIRIGAPRHDRTQAYMPQFLAARSGFAQVAELAGEYGVKGLYEIHTGTVAVTCSRALELLRDLDPERIGAIYDVPNMLRVGLEDTRMGMEVLGPYMAHVHIGNGVLQAGERDENGQQTWQWAFCALQEGVANIPQIVEDLRDVGYAGYVSLEEFGPGDDDEKTKGQGAYLKTLAAR